MSDHQLLALGVIGVRLYDCILTAPATQPDELADHIVDEINNYLPHASAREKTILFHLACDIHEALSKGFPLIDGLEKRKAILNLVNALISRASMLAKQHGN